MAGQAYIGNARPQRSAARAAFTLQHLWRQALWGTGAAAAVLLAVLASVAGNGPQRAPNVFSSFNFVPSPSLPTSQPPPQAAEADSEARQLARTVRRLAEDRDRIMARLAAVEHNVDDMTGSISKQIEAAKAAAETAPPTWPTDVPPIAMVPASIESVAEAMDPSPADLPPPPPNRVARAEPSAAAPAPAYGADIGNASTIRALRARWAEIHSAHARLFEGLRPVMTLRDLPRSNRTELRLLVGPFANAHAAAQLCASLTSFRLFCQPTMFDGHHLALQ